MATIKDPVRRRELVMRLKRVEGQLRGIQAMIEASGDCEKVAQQLSASRRALDKAFFNVIACGVESAAEGQGHDDMQRRVRHAAQLLAKFG